METQREKEKEAAVSRKSQIVSPEGALSFLFTIFALLMWYISVSTSYNDATLLSIGLTWLILSLGAFMASLVNMVRGSEKGNINLLITILLGFFPGVNTMISLMARAMQIPYRPAVVGMMYMIGAVFGIGAAWSRRFQPFYIFLRTLTASIGLFLVGIGDLFSNSFILAAGGWFLFLYALLSFYYGLSRLYPYYGHRLPQGKPLFFSAGQKSPLDDDDLYVEEWTAEEEEQQEEDPGRKEERNQTGGEWS